MQPDVTELLLAWNGNNKEVLDRLVPIVADELHAIAVAYLRSERRAKTLQPTALVNEVYMRLVDRERVDWRNRSHFFGFAATTMRRILVEHARARRAEKRGGEVEPLTLDGAELAGRGPTVRQPDIDILALDIALGELERLDPRLARVVELRFFAGLNLDETAEVLDIGTATVGRDWRTAKAFLLDRLRG